VLFSTSSSTYMLHTCRVIRSYAYVSKLHVSVLSPLSPSVLANSFFEERVTCLYVKFGMAIDHKCTLCCALSMLISMNVCMYKLLQIRGCVGMSLNGVIIVKQAKSVRGSILF